MASEPNLPPNPYAATAHIPRPPKLTHRERKILLWYWDHREQDPSLLRQLGSYLPAWLVSSLLYAAAGLLIAGVTWPRQDATTYVVLGVIAGMLAGSILRDITHLRLSLGSWPLVRQLIDWPKVRARLDEEGL